MYNAAIFGESVQRCCEVNIPSFIFTFQKIVVQLTSSFVILATPDDSLMTQVFILLFVVATCLPSFGLALKTLHKVTSITQKLMQSANASGDFSAQSASAVLV
jgi:hypothetical protein